jgi:hypothetical protein
MVTMCRRGVQSAGVEHHGPCKVGEAHKSEANQRGHLPGPAQEPDCRQPDAGGTTAAGSALL